MILACLTFAALGLAACGGPDATSPPEEKVQPDITLLQAIEFENVQIVRQHMDYGTDPNVVYIPEGFPFAGASALHLAVLKDNGEIVKLLLENGADIEIKAKDEFKSTPLMWAAFWGLYEMAKLLLEEGADVNAPDVNGNTPLVWASVQNPLWGRMTWRCLLRTGRRSGSFLRSMVEGRQLRCGKFGVWSWGESADFCLRVGPRLRGGGE